MNINPQVLPEACSAWVAGFFIGIRAVTGDSLDGESVGQSPGNIVMNYKDHERNGPNPRWLCVTRAGLLLAGRHLAG